MLTKRTAEQLRASIARHDQEAQAYRLRLAAPHSAEDILDADELNELSVLHFKWACEDEDELVDRFGVEAW